MRDFFSGDSRLMRVLSKIFDIGYLSIVFILFCVPIVTIGASFTALYYTTVKVIRRDRGYVFQEFWHSFKTNFGSATVLWLIQLVLTILMYYNITITSGTIEDSNTTGFFSGIYLVLGIIIYAVACYAYPVLSRFVMKKGQIIRLSLFLAIRYIYFTVLFVAISAAAILSLVVLIPYAPIIPLLVPALAALAYSFMMEPVLKKYMPKEESEVTKDGEVITKWYNE